MNNVADWQQEFGFEDLEEKEEKIKEEKQEKAH